MRSTAYRAYGSFGTFGALCTLCTIVGLAVLAPSCTLTLDEQIACGDGYVDRVAGEECDPQVEDSYVDACLGTSRPDGTGACDPDDCTLVRTIVQCAVCGDDEVDPEVGEECDGSNLNGAFCPGSSALPRCTSDCLLVYDTCPTCGNGVTDEGEECDPAGGGLAGPLRSCEELPSSTDQEYTSGFYAACDDDCTFSRAGCGFCGNGKLEGILPLDLKGSVTVSEVCDRGDFDDLLIESNHGNSPCYEQSGQRPVVTCNENCLSFEKNEPEECCLLSGEPCPSNGTNPRCCYEVDHPEHDDVCAGYIDIETGQIREVCR